MNLKKIRIYNICNAVSLSLSLSLYGIKGYRICSLPELRNAGSKCYHRTHRL